MSGSPFVADFGPFGGRVWLTPLTRARSRGRPWRRSRLAVAMKRSPHAIEDTDFLTVPRELGRRSAA